jgi:selenocysteine lyase/cysteine desulfurase
VETGTQNHEGIAGIAATVDFLASIGGEGGTRRERLTRAYASLHEEGLRLTWMLWDALTSMKNVRVYGPPPSVPRTPTVSFAVGDARSEDVARTLATRGIFASSGDFYAATVCERYEVESLVRVGCACYTTEEEVRRLIEAVAAL